MAFLDTAPRKGDSDNNLLFKIAQELSNRNGGAFPPMLGDSDNNLLYKIAQLIILGGGTAGTCAADLATCNAAAGVSAATIAALQAQIAANPQDMQVEWTPTNLKLGEMFGYGVGGTTNFPGITSITFKGATSVAGFTVSTKANLVTLAFPNLTSLPATSAFSTNPVLTTLSFPVLASTGGSLTASSNAALTTLSFPALVSVGSSFTASSNAALTTLSLPVLVSITANLAVSSNLVLTTLSLPVLASGAGVTFDSNAALTTLSLPALASLSNTLTVTSNTVLTTLSLPVLASGAGINVTLNPAMTTVNFPALVTTTGIFTANSNTVLTTVSLPALVTLGGTMTLTGDPALSSLVLTNYVPTNGRIHTITGAALTDTSVNLILARGVANAAYVTGTINTSGGTSSAPTGQGILDKATLQARGVTVTTN